jgi:hypothetical protein
MLEVGTPSCLNEGMLRWREFKTTSEERQAAPLLGETLELGTHYNKLPSLEVAEKHAVELRTRFIQEASPIAIAETILEQNNVGIFYRSYSAGAVHPSRYPRSELSAARAFLIPDGGEERFTISINTDWSGRYRQTYGDELDGYAAVIGHEVGHLFFFTATGLPRPRISLENNKLLESWCNHFSLHLTGIDINQKKTINLN